MISRDLDLSYLSRPLVSCFEGEGEVPPSETPPGETRPSEMPLGTQKVFTQEDVNKFLAEDRRKHQARLEKMEKEYQALVSNEKLSSDERAKLKESLEDVQKQLRTKDQQLAFERQKVEEEYKTRLTAAEEKAARYENIHRESTIERAILDAASTADTYNPTQILTVLRKDTKLVEVADEKTGKATGKYQVMVDLLAPNPETGAYEVTQMTPAEAVKRMKEMSEWRNLFKSNVVSGVGGNSATGGLTPGSGGIVDVRKLTPAQYQKLRKENPEALGLAPRRR